MKPTSNLQLGNYIGALKNWVALQKSHECIFSSVDLHAITEPQDPAKLADLTLSMVATFLAAGIDEKTSTVFVQSQVPEHSELAWVLNCFSTMGELGRMTQFKDKSQKEEGKENPSIGAGLFNYPVLMAADVLLYRSHLVPVGQDQKQHLELMRDLAIRLNSRYNDVDLFVIPEPYIPSVGAKIMSLSDPLSKMSKSSDGGGEIFILDSDDTIMKKVKRAVTDSGNEISFDPENKAGISNLLTIQSALTGKSIEQITQDFHGKQYGHLKIATAEVVIEKLGPVRDRALDYLKNRDHLNEILLEGATKARERAQTQIDRVFRKIGFIPRTRKV